MDRLHSKLKENNENEMAAHGFCAVFLFQLTAGPTAENDGATIPPPSHIFLAPILQLFFFNSRLKITNTKMRRDGQILRFWRVKI